MQREESRQLSELSLHAQMMRDAAEKKADAERAAMRRTFDVSWRETGEKEDIIDGEDRLTEWSSFDRCPLPCTKTF